MTKSEYQELVEFLAKRFTAIDQRFDAIDQRLDTMDRRFEALEGRLEALEARTTRIEVGLEALRHEVRLVAEGVVTNGHRLDRVESNLHDLTVRFDRFEVTTIVRFDQLSEDLGGGPAGWRGA